jgi:hypothetical protein
MVVASVLASRELASILKDKGIQASKRVMTTASITGTVGFVHRAFGLERAGGGGVGQFGLGWGPADVAPFLFEASHRGGCGSRCGRGRS